MADEFTIDELARRAGTTSRNVRAYQSRGLLPPPRLAGRIGYYDESHLTRLRLIDRLQSRGFALASIKALIDAWEEGASLSDVLGFDEALLAPWSTETPETVTPERLAKLFPETADAPGLVERAMDLGLLVREGDNFRAPSPRLLRIGSELVAAGIPLGDVFDEAAALRADTQAIATRFVDMFRTHVWEPFLAGRFRTQELSDVTALLTRLRPLAAESVDVFLAWAMEQAVAQAAAADVQAMLAQGSPGGTAGAETG